MLVELFGVKESSQNRPSPERPAQLLILEDALLKVGREKVNCMKTESV